MDFYLLLIFIQGETSGNFISAFLLFVLNSRKVDIPIKTQWQISKIKIYRSMPMTAKFNQGLVSWKGPKINF